MSKYTKRAIIQAFMRLVQSKSFDKITVTEIIQMADINRNTFYYHYQDINDLLDSIFAIAADRFRHETQEDRSFFEAYKRAADTMQANRSALIHIFNSSARTMLIRFLRGSAMHFVRQYVEQEAEATGLSAEGKEFITSCYSYSVLGVVLRWIECRMPAYRMEMVETFAAAYEATVGIMMETYLANVGSLSA